MHEVSLGQTLRDYLTGQQVDHTTYEDLRQALARILVEEKGYPAASLQAKVAVRFPVAIRPSSSANEPETHQSTQHQDAEHETYCRTVDIVAYSQEGKPLVMVLFCPGQVNTYKRESLAAARLISNGPAPLIVVTDTKQALLFATHSGTLLEEGMHAIPRWDELTELVKQNPAEPPTSEQIDKERRILHTYSEFIKTCCDESVCML